MELEIGAHLDETELEQYSMGTLSASRLDSFEEHFLACDTCQDRLLEMEAYVNAMRSVSPKVRPARKAFWGDLWRPRPAWVASFALGAVAVTVGIRIVAPTPRVDMAGVILHASRGNEGLSVQAPAGKILTLNIELKELPAFPSYRLEAVNTTGKVVWATVSRPHAGSIYQPMEHPLAAGQYYVRLYSPANELLREFSLVVNAREE